MYQCFLTRFGFPLSLLAEGIPMKEIVNATVRSHEANLERIQSLESRKWERFSLISRRFLHELAGGYDYQFDQDVPTPPPPGQISANQSSTNSVKSF